MSITRRSVLTGASLLLAAPALRAQPVFSRPIRLVVAFGAGGSSDILARLLAPKLTESLGQPVVVENRTGANGNIAADNVAKSPKDGHALLIMDVGSLAIAPALTKALPYDPLKDLAPVAMVAFSPWLFAIHPSLPVRTVADLASFDRAHPGKLNVALAGIGAANHLTSIEVAKHLGLNWEYVPYRGGGPAIQAVVQNDCQAVLNGATATQPFVVSGQLNGIAVSGASRLPALPDMPSFAELGMPRMLVESGSWQGMLTTAGTPPAVVARLAEATQAALEDPGLKQRITDMGGQRQPMTPPEFGTWMAANATSWGKVVRDNDLTLD